jgi:adenylosuccinate lyase
LLRYPSADVEVFRCWSAHDLENLKQVLARRAHEFEHTPTIGRTHGIHAEPTTFGLKLANWYAETVRKIERFQRSAEEICVGKRVFGT